MCNYLPKVILAIMFCGIFLTVVAQENSTVPQDTMLTDTTYLPVYEKPDSIWWNNRLISPYSNTRSQTTLTEEDFLQGNRYNTFSLLQGMVPGLMISRPGSGPNGNFDLRLRGYNSFGNSRTSPLIVINGIPETDVLNLDPLDIASIQVLRDVGSSAKYGLRGSQGVIEIRTNQPDFTGTQVRYQAFLSSENNVRKLESLSADEFRGTSGFDFGDDTDWISEITQNAISQAHHLSVSHQFKQTSVKVGLHHRDVEGIIKTSGYKQSGGRLNISHKALNDKFQLSMNLAISQRNATEANPQVYKYALIANPTMPVFDENQTVYGGYSQQVIFDSYNPVALIEQQERLQERISTTGSATASYEILEGLAAHATLGAETINAASQSYFDKDDFQIGGLRNGQASQQNQEVQMEYLQLHGTYEKSLPNLDLQLSGGYSWQQFTTQDLFISGGNFLTDEFTSNNLGAGLDFSNGLGRVESGKVSRELAAYWGEARISLKNKFFLNANYRREGSSTFSPDNKWGNYYGVNLGVDLTQQIPFLWVTHFKPRISFGRVGNAPQIPGLSSSILSPVGVFFFNGNFIPGFGLVRGGNAELREEETTEFNLGLDFSLFQNRIHGSLDIYSRNTDEIILQTPTTAQSPGGFANLASTSMRGWDLSLQGWVMQKRDFHWQANLVFSGYGDNLLESLGPDNGGRVLTANPGAPGVGSAPMVLLEEGAPLGQLYGFAFEEITTNGQWQYQDLNGDGRTDFFDQGVVGDALPSLTWSLVQQLRWKQLDLQFMFRASRGHDLYHMYRFFYENPATTRNYNRINTELYLSNLDDFPGGVNSYYLEDASYVRMEYLTLGYSLKQKTLPVFSHLRAYITFQNLFTFTDYTGDDPEVRLTDPFGGFGVVSPGIDRRGTYPLSRGIMVGVDVGL
ncbi:MAG: SusC/RagA family TonB-linked outer membrane protein [Bacteroidota bacterium]